MINPGKLDRRVIIQAKTETQNSFGETIETWATFKTIWAEKKTATGREAFQSGREVTGSLAVFTGHYLAGVTTEHRILEGSTVWDILSVNEIGRKEGLELVAESLS